MGHPPEPRYGQDRGGLLTLRALALESLQRQDLSLRLLTVRAGQALLVCVGWTLVLGGLDDLSRDAGHGTRGVFALAGGILALGGTVGALARAAPARWRLSRQLYAWARWHTDPAVRAAPPGPPGTAPPGPPTFLGRRLVWGAAGVPTVALGAYTAWYGIAEPLDSALTAVFVLWGAVIGGAGTAALWKAHRLYTLLRYDGAEVLPPGAEHLSPGDATRRRHPPGSASLTDPATRYARLSRLPPLAFGLAAALVTLPTAAVLGRLTVGALWPAAAVVALALTFLVLGYDYRPRFALGAFFVGVLLLAAGTVVQQHDVLAERGRWIDAEVLSVDTPARGGTICEVRDTGGSGLRDRVRSCFGREPGDTMRLLVDPEGEVDPATREPRVVFVRGLTSAGAALFAAAVLTGLGLGHRNRRRLARFRSPKPFP